MTLLVIVHILGACIWTGGHLILATRVLPEALRTRDLTIIQGFEAKFETIGLPALLLQIVTGFWLAFLRGHEGWPPLSSPEGQLLAWKLSLLALTVALALHARLKLIPSLDAKRLPLLGWHIFAVTLTSVAFVVIGVMLRDANLASTLPR